MFLLLLLVIAIGVCGFLVFKLKKVNGELGQVKGELTTTKQALVSANSKLNAASPSEEKTTTTTTKSEETDSRKKGDRTKKVKKSRSTLSEDGQDTTKKHRRTKSSGGEEKTMERSTSSARRRRIRGSRLGDTPSKTDKPKMPLQQGVSNSSERTSSSLDKSVFFIEPKKGENTSSKAAPTEQERGTPLHAGMLDLGSRLLSKRVWHKRFFRLYLGGWLAYYESKKPSPNDEPSGWINLSRCTVALNKSGDGFSIKNVKKERIWLFTHGGSASKKRRLINRGTFSCKLRASSKSDATAWSHAFSVISAERNEKAESKINELQQSGYQFASSEDDEGDLLSSSDGSEDSSDESDSDKSSSSSSAASSSAASASSSKASRLQRTESLSVIRPDADHVDEEPVEKATEEKKGLMALLKQAVGSDLTAISMPISIHEPTSFLQRMAENVQYNHLLDKAAMCDNPIDQLMYVTAFAVSTYSCNTRTGKPFNPYLGETYEYTDPSNKSKFVAEQVSHHPPIGACQLENENFLFYQDQAVKTKFGGNNLDVTPTGQSHVVLKKSNNHFTWRGVRTVVYNIIIGSMWVDHFGDTEVVSLSGGEKAKLKMNKCGWFSKGRYEVKATLYDANGKEQNQLVGMWNAQLTEKKGGRVVWENTLAEPVPGDKHSLSPHVHDLCKMEAYMQDSLPKTDSRFRKDVTAMQRGDNKAAAAEKKRLEERQRSKRKDRNDNEEEWQPKYFEMKQPHPKADEPMWMSNQTYQFSKPQ
mmetsp:Transcript_5517/g.8428  ORF Transcript_5517/g.8428 Transcript_5517/m.8428 type:complete len:758 (+) Transcript_5517:489-2762(+)